MKQQKTISHVISFFSQNIDLIDIELIIAHVLQKDRAFVIAHHDMDLSNEECTQITQLCKKRTTGYPLAYITGYKDFFGREFHVSEETLVPRSDTELIITSVLNNIEKRKINDIFLCDIGTGSGIIPITLKKELDKRGVSCSIIASDISKNALDIAQKNITHHNANDITLYHTSLINDAVLDMVALTEKSDIFITANLPYVDTNKKYILFSQKESEALKHEPDEALWSDDSGTKHYKKLIQQMLILHTYILKEKNIFSFYEIDPDQSNALQDFISKKEPESEISILKDLSGRARVIQWNI